MYVWNICNFRHSKCHLEQFFLITYINYYNLHRHNYRTLKLYRSMYDTGRWLYLTVKNIPLCQSLRHLTVQKDLSFPVNLINDGKSVFLLPGNWQLFIWLHRRTPEGWINTTQQPKPMVSPCVNARIQEKNKTWHSSNIDIPPTQEIFQIVFKSMIKTF